MKGNSNESSTINLYSAIKMLIEKNWDFRRLISVMLVGFGIGMKFSSVNGETSIETKGRTLSDTMDEEEYKESVFVC
ncbi:hypothetical protein KY290_025638 [Solanum tuberosum]|uniref:Uncharacterized protein n=1 Tax=Solanum tuberosum TaxID=4113 RepID=A0ABQ7UVA8_SOLTU|nr:hypothetical protein KY289_024713 [Solanum tuberosum]KAH0755368.1 hypothetical protein KY290_025638 [Solanum tuberosum]